MTTLDQHTDDVDERQTFATQRADALRALADLIEARPDLAGSEYTEICLNIFPDDADAMAALVRQLGGAREKLDHGKYLTVRRDFGARVVLDIAAQRDQVCEPVVIGTHKVEVANPNAPKILVDEPIVEWRCSPILTQSIGIADARASLVGGLAAAS